MVYRRRDHEIVALHIDLVLPPIRLDLTISHAFYTFVRNPGRHR